MNKKRCLVIGFDRFAGLPVNQSEQIVQSLPESMGDDVLVEKLVLPTCCEKSWTLLEPKLTENFDCVLVTGALNGVGELQIERFALNIRDYPIDDNAGHRWQGMQIDAHQPAAFMTNIDAEALATRLMDKGHPCRISNHAGTFVCNEAYFRVLCHRQLHDIPKSGLLVHLPLPEHYATTAQAISKRHGLKIAWQLRSSEKQLEFMKAGVIEILEFCSSCV